MPIGAPLAYLITWTCKGARLHGQAEGSVDRDHRTFGAPLAPKNLDRLRCVIQRMRHPGPTLDPAARQLLTCTIREVTTHRHWNLLAANVRSNHVHVVVGAGAITPERIMNDLKAWCTRRLRQAGVIAHDTLPWTRHGSTRYLWNEQQVAASVQYVNEEQDSAHRAPATTIQCNQSRHA